MSLSPFITGFKSSLEDLWANPTETSTIFATCDLIESFWSNAVVTGYEVSPCVLIPHSTYPGLTPLYPGDVAGTAVLAAQCFESACSAMVLSTLFSIIAPPFTTPPPVMLPGGPAAPGILTTVLTAIFLAGSVATTEFFTAGQVADAITAYLQSWLILVTIPPAAAVLVPII